MFGFLKKSADPAPDTPVTAQPPAPSWRERLMAGLARTRAQLGGRLKSIFSRGKVDDELLEELEALLLTSDVGLDATQHLLDELQTRTRRDRVDTPEGIQQALGDGVPGLGLGDDALFQTHTDGALLPEQDDGVVNLHRRTPMRAW